MGKYKEPVEPVEPVEEPAKPKVAKMKEAKEAPKPTERTMVIAELPTRPLRRVEDEDGNIINLITIEEALTQLIGEGGL